jgi:phosphoglycerate dehydrogenase-like enzyme
MAVKPKALYILDAGAFEKIYGLSEQAEIAELTEIYAPQQNRHVVAENPALLADAEIIFTGWGAPKLDNALLTAAPRLKAFFYGAGATGGTVAPEAYARGIVVTSAAWANAVPVAEYTVAAITLSLKQVFRSQREIYATGVRARLPEALAGAYGTVVGLVSLGAIGRLVVERLRCALPDAQIVVHDPFVDPADAAALGVELIGLDALFARADVVSLHTPWLPETEGLIRGRHIAAMRHGASLINTARGAVIAEDEMIAVLTERPDLNAILDVTHPEPPPPGSPLLTLPNVFLTPHIAGSESAECRRMGRYMVEELRRFITGEPLRYQIRPETAVHTSHRPAG